MEGVITMIEDHRPTTSERVQLEQAANRLLGVSLKGTKLDMLLLIGEHKGVSVSALGKMTEKSTPTASRHTDEFVNLGLIRKEHFGVNGKEQCCELTDKGQAYYNLVHRLGGRG
jgi:DNA-binding MarR family transcriptional regulator